MEKHVFRDFLKSKGLKFTRERECILDEVFAVHGHFDPEQLLARLRERCLKVSKASLYRTLPLLVESGLIEQVEKNDKHAHYEHTYGHSHHDHLICLSCGTVFEVFSPELEDVQEDLCRKADFRGVSHTLEVRGYCGSCVAATGGSSPARKA
jgi:Fur family ferric uptake transcriptional regulator